MLLTALAIKLDSRGPVLFKQKRYGFNNELIEVYKFRSMYVDQCDATASKLVQKDDPRVTRVGALHPQDLARRTAAAASTSCSRAISRWSGRARMRPCQGGGPAL